MTRKTLLKKGSFEAWFYTTRQPEFRWKAERWAWHDGRHLIKKFLRIGQYVFCLAWLTGKAHP